MMAACCSSSSSTSLSSDGDDNHRSREDAMQRRLDQMRRERQSELKTIGRMVADSGQQDSRQAAVSRLLDRSNASAAAGSGSSAAAASTSADSSSTGMGVPNNNNSSSPAASAILVEVRGLSELRPVSRILQSSSFRTELESLVRYSLSPRQQQQQQQQRPSAQQQQPSAPSPQPDSSSQQQQSLTELRRQRHNELVQEISELLHSQLVTSGLDGNFRARLERELRSRAEALPDGGRRAEAALRRLPPSSVMRNDFSHLGIWQQHQQDDAASSLSASEDVVSVVSVPIGAAATAAAAAMASGPVSRQLHSVQREVTELRRTVRLLLGNQLETQRMIRQEVAAALAGRAPSQQPQQPAGPPPTGACLVCLTARADTVMYRCGHLCLCHLCTARMRDSAADGRLACPVCRAPVVDTMRVFAAGVAGDAAADGENN